MQPGQHTLHVTAGDPELGEDDYNTSVECHGVTDECRLWIECEECSKAEDSEARSEAFKALDRGETLVFHDEQHMASDYSESIWVRTEQCLSSMDSAAQSACNAGYGLSSGDYPVEVIYEGDGETYIDLIKTKNEAAA